MTNIYDKINTLCSENNTSEIIHLCVEYKLYSLGLFLCTNVLYKRKNQLPIHDDIQKFYNYFLQKIIQDNQQDNQQDKQQEETITLKLLCNWTSSKELTKLWNKMTKGDYKWNNLKLIMNDDIPDYYVVINYTDENIPLGKCIYFPMEPNMTKETWGRWVDEEIKQQCFFYADHTLYYNNIEWHLDKTYNELLLEPIEKIYNNEISCILSAKYTDEGQRKRINFTKYIDNYLDVHVYGSNKFRYKNYKGELPYHNKNNGLFPYKYHFNAENNNTNDYYITEKLIDGILSECVVFYYGTNKVYELFDPECFVKLNLDNFEQDLQLIKNCIDNDVWTQKISIIRKEKHRILNNLSMFSRIEKILKNKI